MARQSVREQLGFTIPTKCDCCNQCWLKPGHDRCLYGGPYRGYVDVSGQLYSSIEEAGLVDAEVITEPLVEEAEAIEDWSEKDDRNDG